MLKGKKKNLSATGLFLFTFYVFTQRFFDLYSHIRVFDITVSRICELLIVSISLVLIMAGTYQKYSIGKRITLIDYFWLPGIIIILTNILISGSDKYDFFIYAACFAFLIVVKVDIEDYSKSLVFIKYAALFYALGSIVQYLVTEPFNEFLASLTSRYSLGDMNNMVYSNYYPGFGFNRTAVSAFYASAGLGYFFSFWDKKQKYYYLSIVITGLLILGLFVTGKRSILLWSFVALALTYIADSTGKGVLKRLMTIMYASIIFLVSYLLFRHFVGLPEFLSRIDMLINAVFSMNFGGSIAVRILLYRDAWLMFLENPLFGVGWNQFRAIHPAGDLVHNIYIQFLTETGIVGFLAIVTPMFFVIIKPGNLYVNLCCSKMRQVLCGQRGLN